MGALKTWTGSAWVFKPVKVWTGAAWALKPVKRWTGTAWQVASGITSVALSTYYILTTGANTGMSSATVTAGVTGGSGSFAYLWSFVSGDDRISPDSPTLAATKFTIGGLAPGEGAGANYVCTVTDTATGEQKVSDEIAVDFART